MIILDAASIGEWQSCRRRYVLSRDWRMLKWRPKDLYTACLRQAVLSIVQDRVSPADAAAAARTRFLQSASNPGLDILTDPFLAARDWCAMLDTTIRSLNRGGLPTVLEDVPLTDLGDQVMWDCNSHVAHVDGQSTLHRWIAVDRWGEGDIARELHSWRTIGDAAATGFPMTIHVVVIGQTRNGRRSVAWARSLRHPTFKNLQMHFKGKDPKSFKGWKPFYLADTKLDPDAWVEQMWNEGAAQDLLHEIRVKQLPEEQRERVRKDIRNEAAAIRTGERQWNELPMSRNACDVYVPCPFQYACYANYAVKIEELGLFQSRRLTKTAEAARR